MTARTTTTAPSRAVNGELVLVLGPMFSEKTHEVARRINRARLGGQHCVIIRHPIDVRYGSKGSIRTHDGWTIEAGPATADLGRLRIVEAATLEEVKLDPDELDIGIDEGQFYSDLRGVIDRWMQEGRRVCVSALDGDFRRKLFDPIAETIPLATQITKQSAVCMYCKQNAYYSARIVPSDEQILIGEKDKYRAACLSCYLQVQ